MILGERHHFTRDHFEAHKGTAPAHLAELVVHCLELVAQLKHHGLAFRFKGGNSLLILLEDPQRFSIDVDIVTTESKEKLTAVVEDIVRNCDLFTRYESRAPKTKPWLPMISFKLFFESQYQPAAEAYVMLDCVLEPPPYAGVARKVRCGQIYASGVEVEVPSPSGLIGDKLLTIGPSTLGIPLGKGKEAQRLKHVFDVALLARGGYAADEVRAAIDGCMVQENRIQGRTCSFDEVLADTLRFLDAPLAHAEPPPLDGVEAGSYLYEIVKGYDPFRAHLFRIDYTWERLRDDCRRVRDLLQSL